MALKTLWQRKAELGINDRGFGDAETFSAAFNELGGFEGKVLSAFTDLMPRKHPGFAEPVRSQYIVYRQEDRGATEEEIQDLVRSIKMVRMLRPEDLYTSSP